MQGCHQKMGDIWLPKKAMSRYVISGCFKISGREWNNTNSLDTYWLRYVAKATCVINTVYYAGLQSEEVNIIDTTAMTRKH